MYLNDYLNLLREKLLGALLPKLKLGKRIGLLAQSILLVPA